MRVSLLLLFVVALVAAACSNGASPTTGAPPGESTAVATTATVPGTTSPPTTAAPTTAPAPATTTVAPATTAPATTVPASGLPSATCANGWKTPVPGTPLRKQPLDLIRGYLGLDAGDLFIVETMRYFRGPEDIEVIAPRRDVDRWYVEAHLQSDPSVAGRWIVRYVNDGILGVMAEAPAGTVGFEAGTWTMYSGEGGVDRAGEMTDPFNPPCTAAHGPYCTCNWGVEGCSCSDDEHPLCTGIPPTVMGCLDGL